ncbi:MAG: cytochrome c3 family protein [Caldimonas sp.]
MKGNTPAHTAVGAATCQSCHEFAYAWYGVRIRTPESTVHHGRRAGQDCISSGCHNRSYSAFVTHARVRPVLRAAVAGANTRFLPDGTALPSRGAGLVFDHQGVLPGQCRTCHNGQAAKGQPAKHLVTRASCDTCHRTTAWTPAHFNHQGVLPGQCQTCHNSSSAAGKTTGHFVTARSCDTCHRTIGWVPVSYSHLSALYRASADKPLCVSCHVTNGEIIPRQLRGGPRPRPVPGP